MNEAIWRMATRPAVRSGGGSPASTRPKSRGQTSATQPHITGVAAPSTQEVPPLHPWLEGCHPLDPDCVVPATPPRPNSHGTRLPARWWIRSARTRSAWIAATPTRQDGTCQPPQLSSHVSSEDEKHPRDTSRYDEVRRDTTRYNEHPADRHHHHLHPHLHTPSSIYARTQIGEGDEAVGLAVLPRLVAGRMCAQRKVPLANLSAALQQERGDGAASTGVGLALPCSAYTQPTLMGQEVQHAQFTNYFSRQHIFQALRWWPSEAYARDDRHSLLASPPRHRDANSAQAGAADDQASSSCVAPPSALGVMIGTAESKLSWLCALPAANPSVSCPCCWALRADVSSGPASAYKSRVRELVGCRVWNANWR